jgi:hypothetical protein
MLQISIDVIKPNTYSYGEVNNNIQHIKFCTCVAVLNWNRQWNVNWYETSVKILVEGNTQCKNNHNLGNQNKKCPVKNENKTK